MLDTKVAWAISDLCRSSTTASKVSLQNVNGLQKQKLCQNTKEKTMNKYFKLTTICAMSIVAGAAVACINPITAGIAVAAAGCLYGGVLFLRAE